MSIPKRLVPDVCSEIQMYECCVPMPILGRVQGIDLCIADIVAALVAANIQTVNSCCGHKQMSGTILLQDGRMLTIEFMKEAPHDE